MGFMPTNEELSAEAENYPSAKFFSKSKNLLTLFIIFVVGITVLLSGLNDDVLLGGSLFLFLAIFVYRNHRWAMILFCLFFVAEKAYQIYLFLSIGTFRLTPILFAFFAIFLTYSAVKVAGLLAGSEAASNVDMETDDEAALCEEEESQTMPAKKRSRNTEILIFLGIFIVVLLLVIS